MIKQQLPKRYINALNAAVNRGVKFLDKKVPDWYTRINTKKLNIKFSTTCICGQLFNGYVAGCEQLFGNFDINDIDKHAHLGFFILHDSSINHDAACEQAKVFWVNAIKAKKSMQQLKRLLK